MKRGHVSKTSPAGAEPHALPSLFLTIIREEHSLYWAVLDEACKEYERYCSDPMRTGLGKLYSLVLSLRPHELQNFA